MDSLMAAFNASYCGDGLGRLYVGCQGEGQGRCCRVVTAAMGNRWRPGREEVGPRLLVLRCRSLGIIYLLGRVLFVRTV